MKYRKDLYNKNWFLKDPRCKKWIVQCAACQEYGRKPETPLSIPKYKFEENFPTMKLDENRFCEICAKVLK